LSVEVGGRDLSYTMPLRTAVFNSLFWTGPQTPVRRWDPAPAWRL